MAWLYEQIFGNPDERKPHYAEQSSLNWMRALRFEVERQHGAGVSQQFSAIRKAIRVETKMKGESLTQGRVLEPLFGGITNSMALVRLSRVATDVPWVRPSAAVIWYYAMYGSVRAILAAIGQQPSDNHASAMNAYVSNVRVRMPHEYRIYVHPIRIGEGNRLFPPSQEKVPLRLIETRAFGNGVVLLRYERVS